MKSEIIWLDSTPAANRPPNPLPENGVPLNLVCTSHYLIMRVAKPLNLQATRLRNRYTGHRTKPLCAVVLPLSFRRPTFQVIAMPMTAAAPRHCITHPAAPSRLRSRLGRTTPRIDRAKRVRSFALWYWTMASPPARACFLQGKTDCATASAVHAEWVALNPRDHGGWWRRYTRGLGAQATPWPCPPSDWLDYGCRSTALAGSMT